MDQEPDAYPADILQEWKKRHEAWVLDDGGLEPLPELGWTTKDGLFTPPEGGTLTEEDFEKFRDHTLAISNKGDQPVEAMELRIQFPELLLPVDADYSPHNQLGLSPDRAKMVASGSGGGEVSAPPESPWFENYLIDIGLLHPHETVEITFRSTPHEHTGPFSMGSVSKNNERDPVLYHIEGSCIIAGGQNKFYREFAAPFTIDPDSREAELEDADERPYGFQIAREMSWHA